MKTIVQILISLTFLSTLANSLRAYGQTESPSLPRTLIRKSEFDQNIEVTPKAFQTFNNSQLLPAQVSIFYPTNGQSVFGICWQGLRIDSNNNVYPVGNGEIYKILSDGTLVNGKDDQNYFASDGRGFWAELDEKNKATRPTNLTDKEFREQLTIDATTNDEEGLRKSSGNFYTTANTEVLGAPFIEGSTFSSLLSGLSNGQAIILGKGFLAGSLFATEAGPENRVSKITLSPLAISEFASGSSFFNNPEAIASAPKGTLYVVNIGFSPPQLTKITPMGVPSTFALGTELQFNRAVIVDRAGNVYWSNANGINKYERSGKFLGTLPGPPDKPFYGNPMGSAFDKKGNLFIVDNFDCKKIYKYTFPKADVLVEP